MHMDLNCGEIFIQESEIQDSLAYGPWGPYGNFFNFHSTKEVLRNDEVVLKRKYFSDIRLHDTNEWSFHVGSDNRFFYVGEGNKASEIKIKIDQIYVDINNDRFRISSDLVTNIEAGCWIIEITPSKDYDVRVAWRQQANPQPMVLV